MDILLTGGTGAIGRVLCHRLLAKGHKLTVLSRRPEKVKAICGAGVAAIAKLEDLPSSAQFDAVINLAGEPVIGPYWTANRKKVLWDSRVGVTEQLVELIARLDLKPQVLINASAVGYYGNSIDAIVTEDTPGGGGFAHTLCDGWETAAGRVKAHSLRLCIVRIGLVLMPHGGMLKSMLPPFRFGLGARLGDGRQWMPWIHCLDLVAMFELLLEHPELEGVFNGVAPNPVTNREFTESLARHLNRPAWFCAPAFLLKLAMGEMGELLLGGQFAQPKRFVEAGFEFRYPTLNDAFTEIIG